MSPASTVSETSRRTPSLLLSGLSNSLVRWDISIMPLCVLLWGDMGWQKKKARPAAPLWGWRKDEGRACVLPPYFTPASRQGASSGTNGIPYRFNGRTPSQPGSAVSRWGTRCRRCAAPGPSSAGPSPSLFSYRDSLAGSGCGVLFPSQPLILFAWLIL